MVYKFIQPIYDDFGGIFYDFVYHIGSSRAQILPRNTSSVDVSQFYPSQYGHFNDHLATWNREHPPVRVLISNFSAVLRHKKL